MTTIREKIMAIEPNTEQFIPHNNVRAYRDGHIDGRRAAADIAEAEVARLEARVRELENNSIFESKKLRELSTFFGVACPESDEDLFNQSGLILGHILRVAKRVIGGE